MNDVVNAIREKTEALLAGGRVGGVLGLARDRFNVVQPRVFRKPEEIANLVVEPKWNLAKLAMTVLRSSEEAFRLAVVCRGCDERAMVELSLIHISEPTRPY